MNRITVAGVLTQLAFAAVGVITFATTFNKYAANEAEPQQNLCIDFMIMAGGYLGGCAGWLFKKLGDRVVAQYKGNNEEGLLNGHKQSYTNQIF